MKRVSVLILVTAVFLLVACGTPAPKPSVPSTPAFSSPVSAQTFNSPMGTQALNSPVPTPEATYDPLNPSYIDPNTLPIGPAFAFAEPVKAGDTVIKGTGGPNVPIRIVSISDAGDIVASGAVGSDGKFSLPVDAQLVKGTRLGIILGETAGTNFNKNDFVRGPNYSDLPFIGVVFTDTLVQ